MASRMAALPTDRQVALGSVEEGENDRSGRDRRQMTKPKARPAAKPASSVPPVLKARLPGDHEARIAYLRKQQPGLPHYERYLAGEHVQVWKDLVALGAEARS